MECVTCLAEMFLEHAVRAIGRQVRYLICYRSNIEELKKKLAELQDKRIVVQHSIDEARRNAENIEDEVQHWMNRVDQITSHAHQFHEEEESHGKDGCNPNLWLRHQLSRKAKKMTLEIVEVHEKGNFNIVSYRDSPQWIQESSSNKSNVGLESRMSIMNEVIESLKDPTINMVGLCGLGGVGKTTIAIEVGKKVMDEGIFDKVIIATVSDNPNIEKIQEQITEMLGMRLDKTNESIRSNLLKKTLKQEKNLLLILDDLWMKVHLDKIGFPLDANGKIKDDNERRKILLTSRNEKLLSDQMKCKRNIKVDVLPKKEAQELFKGIAELHDDCDFLSIAHEIVQLCAGLPIRIVAAAEALKNKTLNEWKDALQRFKTPLRENITGIEEADSIFLLSYEKLSQELQPIFLLCAMLSHDPLIINLLMYSVGLGLFQGIESMEQARVGLEALINQLRASSLLLESSSSDHFTMHDVIRDVALSIAFHKWHVFVARHRRLSEWPDKSILEGYTGIYLDKSDFDDLPEELYGPRLKFFSLHSKNLDLHIPSTFFKPMHELQVMVLTDVRFSSLPSSLSLLEKLRTLCLHSCVLEDIAEVGKLKSLKVLSLADSKIVRLPSELGQLTCLQMLNLANCSELKAIPPNVLSNLKRLEVLCMENSFNQWEAEGSCKGNENANLAELKHMPNLSSLDIHILDASILPKDLFLQNCLERYKIFIGKGWKWSSRYETSKTLKLKLKTSIRLEHGVWKLLERVEDLCLHDEIGITNILNDMNEEGFPHLKYLRIENNHQIEYVVNNSTDHVDAFPKLDTMSLVNLNGLNKLCKGRIATAFQNLRVLRVSRCDRMNYIFTISMLKCLCNLVEIEIVICKSVQGIVITNSQYTFEQNSFSNDIIFHQLHYLKMFGLSALTNFCIEENAKDEDSNTISKSLFSNKVLLPKLEILEFSNLNNFIPSIWDDRLPHSSFSGLKRLIVKKCGFVKFVPFHVLKSLNNLEELEVSYCYMLEVLFDFEELNDCYKETQSLVVVPLKKLRLLGLPKLKNVWSNESQGIVSFQSLRQVYAFGCNSLKSMFPASIAKGLLHLENLDIALCGVEVVVAKDQISESSAAATCFFPRLTSLWFYELPNLRNFYPERQGLEWPHLQLLDIGYCDELEIFEGSVSAIHQEENTLDSKYPLFSHGKVLPNLEKLRVDGKQADMNWNDQFSTYLFPKVKELSLSPNMAATFPYGWLKRFPKLKKLYLQGEIEEIFSNKDPIGFDDDDDDALVAPFRTLQLSNLGKAKHIWNQHSPRDLLQHQYLHVYHCQDLISLGPSFISLGNLMDLDVQYCDGLTNLLRSSTARSLVHLRKLRITGCKQIEEIITGQQGDEEDEKQGIIFSKLESLELDVLPSLNCFCCCNYAFMFPSLDQVIIKTCPRLTMFCPGDIYTPLLKGIQMEENKKFWDTNLNTTIQQRFTFQEEAIRLIL